MTGIGRVAERIGAIRKQMRDVSQRYRNFGRELDRARSSAKPTTEDRPAAEAKPASREEIDRMIDQVAARYRVPAEMVRAMVERESAYDPAAVSARGAVGLMQVMPKTAEEMGGGDLTDPERNIDVGVRYLRTLLDRYGGDYVKSLAAYNAGPGAVERSGSIPAYPETVEYVAGVLRAYRRNAGEATQ